MKSNETQQVEAKAIAPTFNQAMITAEIESQIATAKAYPRDLAVVKKKIIEIANMDVETASSCFYVVPRGGKTIDGPSVRLAEIALTCYGNIAVKCEIVRQTATKTYAVARCRDLENNVAIEVEVSRRITDKYGNQYSDDLITVTENAAKAIAFRNAVYKVVPAILIKPALERAKLTAVGKAQTLINRRAEVLENVKKLGVTEDRIFASLGIASIEHVGIDELARLIGVFNSVRDNEINVDEAFPPVKDPDEKTGVDALKSTIKPEEKTTPPEDGTGDEETAEPEDETEQAESEDGGPQDIPKFECQNCNKGFDEPKGNKKRLCPHCLSDDIIEVQK